MMNHKYEISSVIIIDKINSAKLKKKSWPTARSASESNRGPGE